MINNEVYFAIGILSALVYFICLAVIIVIVKNKSNEAEASKAGQKRNSTLQDEISLGTLRMKMDSIQGDLEVAQKQMWKYGVEEEEKGKRWRLACLAVAGKSVAALQSCYLLSGTDKTAKDIYDEMLSSLKTVGLTEIKPKDGDEWDQMDLRYRVRNKIGQSPYRICGLVYPGYKFISGLTGTSESAKEVILEPAYIDVQGKTGN